MTTPTNSTTDFGVSGFESSSVSLWPASLDKSLIVKHIMEPEIDVLPDFQKEKNPKNKYQVPLQQLVLTDQFNVSYRRRLVRTTQFLEPIFEARYGQRMKIEIKQIKDLGYIVYEAEQEQPKPRPLFETYKKPELKDQKTKAVLTMNQDESVIIIGTIMKQQTNKPSIIQEFFTEEKRAAQDALKKGSAKYIHETDVVFFEDETGRVQLVPTGENCGFAVSRIVNGVCCAVQGKPKLDGTFHVQDIIFATPSILCTWPKQRTMDTEIFFVSGINITTEDQSSQAKLFQLLHGYGIMSEEFEPRLEILKTVFIVGGSFGKTLETQQQMPSTSSFARNKQQEIAQKFNQDKSLIAKKLDDMLSELSENMKVYVVPGENDPVESFFPQNPIHRCILPKSYQENKFKSIGNPSRLEIKFDEQNQDSGTMEKFVLDVIVSGGQNVNDAMKNCEINDPFEMCRRLLLWGNFCPTAPDTLPMHPGVSGDIFLLESFPNCVIVGGQAAFSVKEFKGTKIVTLPSFYETGIAVIMDKNMNFIPFHM